MKRSELARKIPSLESFFQRPVVTASSSALMGGNDQNTLAIHPNNVNTITRRRMFDVGYLR